MCWCYSSKLSHFICLFNLVAINTTINFSPWVRWVGFWVDNFRPIQNSKLAHIVLVQNLPWMHTQYIIRYSILFLNSDKISNSLLVTGHLWRILYFGLWVYSTLPGQSIDAIK